MFKYYSKNDNTSFSNDYESIISGIFHSLDTNHNKVSGFVYVSNTLSVDT